MEHAVAGKMENVTAIVQAVAAGPVRVNKGNTNCANCMHNNENSGAG